MKLAERILAKLDEAQHQNMKVRQTYEKMGSRKARLTVKEASRMIECMLNEKHDSPNPKTETDAVLLKEASHILSEGMKKLKIVKESSKKVK